MTSRRFKFTLESIRTVREHTQQVAMRQLAHELDRAAELGAELGTTEALLAKACAAQLGSSSARDLTARQAYLERRERELGDARVRAEVQEGHVMKGRDQLAAARRLAAAVAGTEPPAVGAELSEAEHSAVCSAMDRMMKAVAGATSTLLGVEAETTDAVTQLLVGPGGSDAVCARTPLALTIGLSLFGESSRLVQFVPDAFAAKLDGSADGREHGQVATAGHVAAPVASGTAVLRDVKLRVWAELGRARLPVGRAVGLGRGSVVELDREVDDPVDVYANGHRIGTGRLLLVEEGEWAVQIERLFSTDPRGEAGRDAR